MKCLLPIYGLNLSNYFEGFDQKYVKLNTRNESNLPFQKAKISRGNLNGLNQELIYKGVTRE